MRPLLLLIAAFMTTTIIAAQPDATPQNDETNRCAIKRGRLRTNCRHSGIRRVRTYDITSTGIPASFEGFTMVFVTDIHYPSRFTNSTLISLEDILFELRPDVLLLGGDYQEGCEYVAPLFESLMRCNPPAGAYAVMGNNDYERCTDIIRNEMSRWGITLLEDSVSVICRNESRIYVAGARNSFAENETAQKALGGMKESDFVVLLTHTPDYAEDNDISWADLTMAGHTHGGQVTLFGLWAPVTASNYRQRFRTGLNHNRAGLPVITSNGLGTSRCAIRFCAPTEVILLRLHSMK